MKICVFCSSKMEFSESIIQACRDFAHWMAKNNHTLVYGGATVGIMGLIADEMINRGGQVEGYIPADLFSKEIPHPAIQKLVTVKDLFERKRLMMENSEAFVILPGGVGTLDEFFEVLTWKSLRCFDKPIVVYNMEGFWNSMMIMMKDLLLKNVLHDNLLSLYKVATQLMEVQEGLNAQRSTAQLVP